MSAEAHYSHPRPTPGNKYKFPWVDYARRPSGFSELNPEELKKVLRIETFRIVKGLNNLDKYKTPQDFIGSEPAIQGNIAVVGNPMPYSPHHVTFYPLSGNPQCLANITEQDGKTMTGLMARASIFAQKQGAVLNLHGYNHGCLRSLGGLGHGHSFCYHQSELTIANGNPFALDSQSNGKQILETVLTDSFSDNGTFAAKFLQMSKAKISGDGVGVLRIPVIGDISDALADPRCFEFIQQVNNQMISAFRQLNPDLSPHQRAGSTFFVQRRISNGNGRKESFCNQFCIGVAVKSDQPLPLGIAEFAGVRLYRDPEINEARNYFTGTQPMVNFIMTSNSH